MKTRIPVLLICAALAAGCASHSTSPSASHSSSPPATGTAGQAASPSGAGTVSSAVATAPKTAAAARSAATLFLDLYAAGQFSATYTMLSPSAKKVISKNTWLAVHQTCKNAPGTSYTVTNPVLTGRNAVVSVSLAGTQSDLGSDQENFIYRGDRWYFVPPDLSLYKHHTAAQITAKLKSLNECH
jgi:hypothetical protein